MEREKIKTLNKWKYCPPKLIQLLFSGFIWNTISDEILITFDDGPNPDTTPLILETLRQNELRAVFFCVGENLVKYPGLAKDIQAAGHTIANHTFRHKNIRNLDSLQLNDEISKYNQQHFSLFKMNPQYFRPPHGMFTFGLKKELDNHSLKNVMWSLLTYDYKNDINIVKFAVRNFLKSNSIVVLHDNSKCKDIIVESIEFVIHSAKENGYSFGNPDTCLK